MWTYINNDEENDIIPGQEIDWPEEGTICRGFDALRWIEVVAYAERTGNLSMLDPNVCDDCNIIAFAPLNEPTLPNEQKLKEEYPYGQIAYPHHDSPTLLIMPLDLPR